MTSSPTASDLRVDSILRLAYADALKEEEEFLRQKSRATWIQKEDGNNAYFFKYCKGRWNSNKILAIKDDEGVIHLGHTNVAAVAVNFFENLIGKATPVESIPNDLDLPCISSDQAESLLGNITVEDILNTFKGMAKSKSPGPDGLTVEFFLAAWSVIGEDVVNCILQFFTTVQLPRFVNATALALIPKSLAASSMSDYRPIACCNVLYKCIAKILASRLKTVLTSLISPTQAAFVPGRLMGDNIFLAQALCRDYHIDKGPSRFTIKLDIRKAFDSLNWSFLFTTLSRMGFPGKFISWLKICVTSPSHSIKLNGSLEGFFEGKAGLRQGDPLSPYLFVIVMEVLSSCLKAATCTLGFTFHWQTNAEKFPIWILWMTFFCSVMETSSRLNLFSMVFSFSPACLLSLLTRLRVKYFSAMFLSGLSTMFFQLQISLGERCLCVIWVYP